MKGMITALLDRNVCVKEHILSAARVIAVHKFFSGDTILDFSLSLVDYITILYFPVAFHDSLRNVQLRSK